MIREIKIRLKLKKLAKLLNKLGDGISQEEINILNEYFSKYCITLKLTELFLDKLLLHLGRVGTSDVS